MFVVIVSKVVSVVVSARIAWSSTRPYSTRRLAARPPLRSPPLRRRFDRRPRTTARWRPSPASVLCYIALPHLALRLSRVVGLLAKSLVSLECRSRDATAPRHSARRSLAATQLALATRSYLDRANFDILEVRDFARFCGSKYVPSM